MLHHLKASLWKKGTHLLIVGFQGYGTIGRQLMDGAKFVNILGEKIAVRARIHTLGGFSAHAGQTDLLQWFDAIAPSRPRLALTHGEDEPRRILAEIIRQRHGISAELPDMYDTIEL